MAEPRTAVSPARFWRRVLGRIEESREELAAELERAREQYPVLARTVQLSLAYLGYLLANRKLGAAFPRLAFRAGVPPWPPDPEGPDLSDLCPPLAPEFCACQNFDVGACCRIDPELCRMDGISEPGGEVTTCDDLCARYREALECLMEFCERRRDLTLPELRRWGRCHRDVEEIWATLIEQRCINVRPLLSNIGELFPTPVGSRD